MRKLIVLLVAGAFLAAFTVPAMAADWSFFGDSKFHTFWVKESKESAGAPNNLFDDDDLHWGRSAGVAVGASVAAGDVGGFFMFRPVETGLTSIGDFSMMYGTWNFGPGTIIIGKQLGPVNFFPSNQVFLDEHSMVGLGGIFTYFKPMISLRFSGDYGQIHLAAVEPQTSDFVRPTPGGCDTMVSRLNGTAANLTQFGESDTSLPKLEASYGYSFGPVSFSLMGGWQSYEERNPATDKTYDIDSWEVALGVKTSFGPLYINGVVTTGQNEAQYGNEWQVGNSSAYYDAGTDQIIDNETTGFNIIAGVKVNDMVTIEAGYGWLEHELDMISTYVGPNAMEDDTETIYIQAVITLAKGVTITPEIGKIDWGENRISGNAAGTGAWGAAGGDEGDMVYYGAQWRIQF
jgi:hypothetical protein